jgi:ribosomal-protein-alanine N-acetyltransferase
MELERIRRENWGLGFMEKIETKRLLLRDLKETDVRAVHDYASDPAVVRYMDWGPNNREETEAFIQRALEAQKEKPRHHYTLAITLKVDKKLIGSCGVHVSNPDNREGWIGYCFNKQFWGKGYATETAKTLVEFGLKKLCLHRVFATCDPENTASARVLEKTGMKFEGHIREHKLVKGKWRDSLLYAVINQE